MRHGLRTAAAALLLCTACSAAPAVPTVELGTGQRIAVEIVDSAAERRTGLSGRDEVPAGTGMLFRYDEAGHRSFWMADTLVPLDLAWIRAGQVVAVQTLQPCVRGAACPSHTSPGPVDAVLESAAGQLAGVPPGTTVALSGAD